MKVVNNIIKNRFIDKNDKLRYNDLFYEKIIIFRLIKRPKRNENDSNLRFYYNLDNIYYFNYIMKEFDNYRSGESYFRSFIGSHYSFYKYHCNKLNIYDGKGKYINRFEYNNILEEKKKYETKFMKFFIKLDELCERLIKYIRKDF